MFQKMCDARNMRGIIRGTHWDFNTTLDWNLVGSDIRRTLRSLGRRRVWVDF